MKKLLLTGVAALFLATEAAYDGVNAHDDSGNYWIPRCRTFVNWLEDRDTKRRLDPFAMHDGGYCFGLTKGITEALLAAGKICTPSEIEHIQIMKVIIAEADRRPELLHKRFDDFIVDIARATWPCKK
jgi:hypothetical protein